MHPRASLGIQGYGYCTEDVEDEGALSLSLDYCAVFFLFLVLVKVPCIGLHSFSLDCVSDRSSILMPMNNNVEEFQTLLT